MQTIEVHGRMSNGELPRTQNGYTDSRADLRSATDGDVCAASCDTGADPVANSNTDFW